MFLLSHANRPPLASRKGYQARPGQPEDRAFGPTQIHSGFGLNDPSFKCFAEVRSSANILVSRGACCPPVRPGALTVSPDMRVPGRCRSPLPVKDRGMFWLYLAEKFQCAAHFADWSSPGDSDDLDTPASNRPSTDAQLPNRKSPLRSSPVDASLSKEDSRTGLPAPFLCCPVLAFPR